MVFAILRLFPCGDIPALLGALLFGLHPLQVESVAWVSELRDLLCAFFSRWCVWLYLLSAKGTRRVANRKLWCAIAMPAGLLAILCKPSAITLPLVLLVLDRWCIGYSWEKALAASAPLLVINLLFLPITQAAQPVADSAGTATWTRPFIAGDALAFYLLKLAAPFNLGIDYGRTPAEVTGHWWGYVTWIVPAALGYAIWLKRGAFPWLVPAALLSVAALLPVLGFVPFDFQRYSTVADRYAYLALLGPALVVAFAATRWSMQLLLPPAIAILLGLSVLSYTQAGVWRNTIALMTQALQVNSRSYSAYSNLGIGYLAHNQLDAADANFRRALRIDPGSWQSHNGLGISFLRRHDYRQAIAEYRAAIKIYPYAAEVHDNLGVALALEGDQPRAVRSFQIALALNPSYAKAKADLAWARRQPGRRHPAQP